MSSEFSASFYCHVYTTQKLVSFCLSVGGDIDRPNLLCAASTHHFGIMSQGAVCQDNSVVKTMLALLLPCIYSFSHIAFYGRRCFPWVRCSRSYNLNHDACTNFGIRESISPSPSAHFEADLTMVSAHLSALFPCFFRRSFPRYELREGRPGRSGGRWLRWLARGFGSPANDGTCVPE